MENFLFFSLSCETFFILSLSLSLSYLCGINGLVREGVVGKRF